MKPTLIFSLSLLLGGTGVTIARAQQACGAQALTLAQAVAVALKNNPGLQAAEAYEQAVERGVAQARAGFLPRLDFSEGFTRGNNPVYVFGSLLTQRQFAARNFDLGFLNTPTPLTNVRTQFNAALPLFDAGQTSGRLRDARLEAHSATHERQRTRQEVIFHVIKAYLDDLLAQETVRAARSAVEITKADTDRVRARQEQGFGVPSDLLSAHVQVAQTQGDLIRAENAMALARAVLNVTMGLPEAAATTTCGGLTETGFDPGTLEERQARALALRPDYLQVIVARERAVNGTRTARSDFLPKVNLVGSWELDSQTFAARGGNNWTVAAVLNFNLFDGGANWARLAASKARERQAEALRAQMTAIVRLQVREAFLNLQAAQQRVAVSRDAVSHARESLRILQDRYEAGLATITDLLRAETVRTSAEKNLLNALFDHRLGFAALELATGELAANSGAVAR